MRDFPSPSAHSLSRISTFLKPSSIEMEWKRLNRQFFDGALPPLEITWSRRLTATLGLFVYRASHGKSPTDTPVALGQRSIRLSLPLFGELARDPASALQELRNTLAHEMIHQWQFDLLKRRPDHGREFRAMMAVMNHEGAQITVYHSCSAAVASLSRYRWSCTRCGQIYQRHRPTIHPRKHRCGVCRGTLISVANVQLPEPDPGREPLAVQLTLHF